MSFSGDQAPCYVPPGRRPDSHIICVFLSKDSERRTEWRGMQCRQLLIELFCSREVDVEHLVREGTQHQ